jgi:hypothetical protein
VARRFGALSAARLTTLLAHALRGLDVRIVVIGFESLTRAS